MQRTTTLLTLAAGIALLLGGCATEQLERTPSTLTTTVTASPTSTDTEAGTETETGGETGASISKDEGTTPVVTSTSAVALPFPGVYRAPGFGDRAFDSYGFYTPSGNIVCYTSQVDPQGMMYCYVANWAEVGATPQLTGFNASDFYTYGTPTGVAFLADRGAIPGYQPPQGFQILPAAQVPANWYAEYGTTMTQGRFTCTVETVGVTCSDSATGDRVFINRDGARKL